MVKLITDSSSEQFQITVFATLRPSTHFAEESPLTLTATFLEILFHISGPFIFCDPKHIA